MELKSLLDAKALFGPLAPAIPDSDKLDPKLSKVQEGYATDGYLVPVYRNQTGFVYDPDKVPNPPQSWADFTAWLDANPGQFAFNDPSKGGSGQAFVQAAIVNILGDEASYAGDTELNKSKVADWPKVWEWFNANEDKFTITASNNDSLDRVNQGEVMMAAAWDDDTAVSLAKGTLFKRAKLYIPALGMPGGGDSLGIPANAPHKAAAMLFVAYLIRPEVQKQLNATIGSYLARTDVSGRERADPRGAAAEVRAAVAAGRLQGPLHPAVRLRSAAEIGLAAADAASPHPPFWPAGTDARAMVPAYRREAILELARQGSELRVDDIARQFSVSRETVRRDLSYLHSHGLLRRVHGGAMPAQTGWEAAFPQRLVANAAAKRRIAALAASLFRKNDTLMIDTGTTTLMLSAALAAAPKLTVITNSFGVARELGTARRNTRSMSSAASSAPRPSRRWARRASSRSRVTVPITRY